MLLHMDSDIAAIKTFLISSDWRTKPSKAYQITKPSRWPTVMIPIQNSQHASRSIDCFGYVFAAIDLSMSFYGSAAGPESRDGVACVQ